MEEVVMKSKVKDTFVFFLECPDQTEVVVQVYLLNPVFDFISNIIYKLISFYRSLILFIINYDKR